MICCRGDGTGSGQTGHLPEVGHRGRYYHEYTMSIDVTRDSPTWKPPTEEAEETVTEALRDLADNDSLCTSS